MEGMTRALPSLEQEIVIDTLLGVVASPEFNKGGFLDGVGCGLLIAVGLLDLDIDGQSAEEAMHHGEEILAASLERRRNRR